MDSRDGPCRNAVVDWAHSVRMLSLSLDAERRGRRLANVCLAAPSYWNSSTAIVAVGVAAVVPDGGAYDAVDGHRRCGVDCLLENCDSILSGRPLAVADSPCSQYRKTRKTLDVEHGVAAGSYSRCSTVFWRDPSVHWFHPCH